MQVKFLLLSAFTLKLSICQLSAQSPDLLWQHCYGGPADELAYAVAINTDGSLFVAGSTWGEGDDVSGYHEGVDGWVFKTNEAGELQWQLCLGTAYHEWMTGILPLPDGGCMVSGLGVSYPGGNNDCGSAFAFEDFWLLRLSSSGDIEWQQCYGGSNQEIPNSIALATDGGFFIAGFARSDDGDVHGLHGEKDAWVIKTDANGNLDWAISLGGSANEDAFDVASTHDGGCIVAGQTNSSDGDVTQQFGERDAWVIKLSAEGEIIWQQSFGGSEDDQANAVLPLQTGGYLVACTTSSDDNDVEGLHGGTDIWIIKLDDNGVLLWQKCFGGSAGDFAKDLIALQNGNFIITGESASDDGDLTSNYGAYDFWLFEIGPTGNLIWQKSVGGSNYDYPQALQLLANGELLLVGETLSNNHDVSGNHGAYDAWLGRFSSPTSGLEDPESMHAVKVFPNPVSSEVSIEYELAEHSDVSISLFDFLGMNLGEMINGRRTGGPVQEKLVLPKSLQPGIYWISIQTRFGMEIIPLAIN